MKPDKFRHILFRQHTAPSKRAPIHEGDAYRCLQLSARHWRGMHLDGSICCRAPVRLARQMPNIALRCGLSTMGKHWVPVGFNSVSLTQECSVLTRTNLYLLEFAGTRDVERI